MAQIISRAGLSRANFYHYFASKFDVVAALIARLADDAQQVAAPAPGTADAARGTALRSSMRRIVESWSEHGAVICAAVEHLYTVPQIGAAWFAVRDRFVAALAAQVEQERAAGSARPGPAAETVAAMLVCGLERTFYVGTRGLDPRLPSPTHAAAALDELAASAVYGPPGRGTANGPTDDTPDLPGLPEPESGTPDTATTILTAVGELLRTTTLEELSVAQIAEAANSSRATFYFYFASKEDAFAALFSKISEPMVAAFAFAGLADPDASSALREVLARWLAADGAPVAVVRNAVHEWPRRPELRRVYLEAAGRIVTALEGAITMHRGTDTVGAAELAASLWWTVENTFAGSLAAEKHLADAEAVAGLLGDLLVATVFGI